MRLCILHQIRNTLKYVTSKIQEEFMSDLKLVRRMTNKEITKDRLFDLEEKWRGKYPVVIESWQHNWKQLLQYL
ncbi:transposase [Flagellimonas lutimaris]|uniref:transposase n=1 Tax=Flagellimonas lutimaris TaxID=475082 RepID=UPI0021D04158|nr:transposase [Allomuricauda lutimaris]